METFLKQLRGLMNVAYANQEDDIRSLDEQTATTYHPEKLSEGAKIDSVYEKLVVGEINYL